MAIARMIDTDRELCALRERGACRVVELEPEKMHGGGLLVVGALEILVRDRDDARLPRDLDIDGVLDAGELRQRLSPLGDIRELDHHRRLEVAAVWDERVVGL